MLRHVSVFLALAAASPARAEEGGVRGTVLDATTGRPVEGASVYGADDAGATTGADGAFALAGAPGWLTVVSGDHEPEVAPGVVAAGREVELSLATTDATHAYRWFSSVGELTGYTRPEARLAPDGATAGALGVVARDQAGGTAWTLVAVEVTP